MIINSNTSSLDRLYACVVMMAIVTLLAACKPVTVVEGPVSGVPILTGTTFFNLADVGYQQSEFFVSGKANSYVNSVAPTRNGRWSAVVADQAEFKTRIVVYRPIDAATFNGTVIVEWLNVSGGTEAGTDWIMAHTELTRSGYVWVGVSAQKAGIDGGGLTLSGLSLPLKTLSPLRYGSLNHPGDKYAFDIFTKAAKAVVQPGSFKPLGDLHAQRVIAAGESQSADFLVTYVNAIAPIEKLFDGYFIHSRLHGTVGLEPATTVASLDLNSRSPVQVRDDLNVPVMMVQTETDLFILGAYEDRQPDSENFRLWEVAGAAHADLYVSQVGLFDRGDSTKSAELSENFYSVPFLVKCDKPINSGPQHFVVRAAITALDKWIRNGVAPAYADRLEVNEQPVVLARDSVGNALGGVRTPYVDAPTATLSGEGQPGNFMCSLSGTTNLFDKTQLSVLYPDHATYISAVEVSVNSAVLDGYLLETDGELIKAWAQASRIGSHK